MHRGEKLLQAQATVLNHEVNSNESGDSAEEYNVP